MIPDASLPDPAAAGAFARLLSVLETGGPAMVAIFILSVLSLALILWKIMRLVALGAWTDRKAAQHAVTLWLAGQPKAALEHLAPARSLRLAVVQAAILARADPRLDQAAQLAETGRVARAQLDTARRGLRGLELAATIGPLLGLLGTVAGMIAAFQALETAGARADPGVLAGGIWEALLTTAAGMAVAIPASVALTWFDCITDALRHDMEDAATRILHAPIAADQAA